MNRKKDLELLSEVYSEAMGYASGRGSVNTQPGAGGTGDYDDSTGQITQQAEDQNPLENDEGEEESPQERSASPAVLTFLIRRWDGPFAGFPSCARRTFEFNLSISFAALFLLLASASFC